MKIYNTQEAAEKLRVHTRTVLKLINSGQLEARKVAGKWLTTENQLREFLEGKSDTPQDKKRQAIDSLEIDQD